jgi:hypothetical protein
MPTNNYPNIGKVTYGYSHNYFTKIGVSWTVFGANSVDGYQPDTVINLLEPTYTVIFTNLTAAGTGNTLVANSVLEYSFDGNTVHGELGSCFQNVSLTFQNRVISTIWFRVQSGSTGTPNVSVQAWGVR